MYPKKHKSSDFKIKFFESNLFGSDDHKQQVSHTTSENDVKYKEAKYSLHAKGL